MNGQEIYQKIGELLWSIMAKEAKTIFYEGYIYPDTNSCSFEWLTQNGKKIHLTLIKYQLKLGIKSHS